ncbi:MAG: hypothetical protein WA252_09060 [Candidatus Sulfotelmatobacter sp.]
MRRLFIVLSLSAAALAQSGNAAEPAAAPQSQGPSVQTPSTGAASSASSSQHAAVPADNANLITIPAGSQIPISLAQAISTKNAREGDAVYAQTTFPFVMNERVLVPAGTYIQGRISRVERAGHGHGRAEILMHFTSMIYPSGYTVMLPGSVENTPGADNKSVKDSEGTIQQDSNTGKKVEDAAKNGVYGTMGGATAGGLATGSLNGARVGAGAGAAAGVAWALLKRGPDVKLEVGTSIQMEIQRPITLDASRITVASNRQ